MQKVPQGGISEHIDHNENEHRASLEKGNVDAESVILRRRPKAGCEASDASSIRCHRGIGDGMSAKEQRVNTGSPAGRGESLNCRSARIRSRPRGVTERSIVAKRRVTIEEQRDLSSRATLEAARAGRLT